jgi:hypothetical protein
MDTFRREMRTILLHFNGSPWATHVPVQDVIAEYGHFVAAGKTPTQTRRVSLQIFHASRAIDSFLAHIVRNEAAKPTRPAPPRTTSLGSSQSYIRRNTIGGASFNHAEDLDLHDIRNDRNTYLHRANLFPSDQGVKRFLDKTSRIVAAALRFTP